MLLVPELKLNKNTRPVKPLTELEIQEKLYGLKSPGTLETGIHPQLAQARAQIAQLEEALEMSRNLQVQLKARIQVLDNETKERAKQIVRVERERARLERRLSQLTGEKPASRPSWKRALGVLQGGTQKLQFLSQRRPHS